MVLGKLPVLWRPTVWKVVGQGLVVLAVGAGPSGWSDGAMALGKLPLPGRPSNLD